ncbi:fused DSP-PTPase phosphatase/NAD kinase-like protein [Candidiatus Paracoxiella cheracis]|uniref:fused DSP-PTPase phosphatase/NAD kinase-like protein n=1 Tax=Candidiatus Paracoxiella cheracis TaxID=3405120 RepID=UPI003BF5EFC6
MRLLKSLLQSLVLVVSFLALITTYAGLEPATQLAFQSKNIPGIGKVYQIATMEGSIYIAAGKPTISGLRQLRKLKIKTYINLLPQNEALSFDEATTAKKLGMKYIHIPVDLANFNVETIKQFNKAIYPPKGYPIFIHCKTGNRAAMMIAFNNITEFHAAPKAAIDEAKNYGLTSPEVARFIEKTVKQFNLGKTNS